MKKLLFFSCLLYFFTISHSYAGRIVNYKLVERLTFEQLKKKWKDHHLPEFIAPINYEIDVYDIDYLTKWHDGSEIKASGLYLVPVNVGKAMPQLIYHHGTSVKKERGGMFFNGEETLCFFYAVDGYAVIMPDYIGLGRGEKRHLYQHADSEGQAAIDMLSAINELNEIIKVQSSGQLFLTGYSQGGHSTLATQRKIEAEYQGVYKVTASAPMSGAYDMCGAQSVVMWQPYTQPHYLPYLLESYQEAYNMFNGDFYDMYSPKYREVIRRLYSGKYQHFQINDSLPKVPINMVSDSLVKEFKTNPNFPFKLRLEENGMCHWKPIAPILMSYSTKDEEVFYQNTIVAYKGMREMGAKNVRKLQVSNKFGHGNTAGFATLQSKLYFDSFRKGSKKGNLGSIWKRSVIRIAKWATPEESLKRKKQRLADKKI